MDPWARSWAQKLGTPPPPAIGTLYENLGHCTKDWDIVRTAAGVGVAAQAKSNSNGMPPFGFGTQNPPKSTKKCQKMGPKKARKKQVCKTLLFWRKVSFSDAKRQDFKAFWDDFGSSLACFSNGFSSFRFGLDFEAFGVKNVTKTETEKVGFVL